MKVNIGTYPSRLVCDIHTRHMYKKYGLFWPDNTRTPHDYFLEGLEAGVQDLYDIFNWLWFDRRERTVKVRIDKWDTWSMDSTLAHVVLPMLKQLKSTQHGHPASMSEEEWDNILDEMIFAFENKLKDSFLPDDNSERMTNGFRLFGKYFENLWD